MQDTSQLNQLETPDPLDNPLETPYTMFETPPASPTGDDAVVGDEAASGTL